MPKRGSKGKAPVLPGDALDPAGFLACLSSFLDWLRANGYSESTVSKSRNCVGAFLRWCAERGIFQAAEVSRPVLVRYQRHLYHYRTKEGKPLSFSSQYFQIARLRSYFRYLAKSGSIPSNPAADLDLPKLGSRLPRHVLSAREAEAVLVRPDVSTPLGIRDRAILEVFYSTGMRRMELAGLKIFDLDGERGTVMVRQGKGKKDRMIPIGERALAWVEKYLSDVRPALVVEPDDGALFLSTYGDPLCGSWLSMMVRRYVETSGVGKEGSCHLFRHTMATLMLEGGADIRFIQAMLGHADISTTEIYTQVSIRKLKEIHTATHPARMERTTDGRAELFDALDAEGEEEGA